VKKDGAGAGDGVQKKKKISSRTRQRAAKRARSASAIAQSNPRSLVDPDGKEGRQNERLDVFDLDPAQSQAPAIQAPRKSIGLQMDKVVVVGDGEKQTPSKKLSVEPKSPIVVNSVSSPAVKPPAAAGSPRGAASNLNNAPAIQEVKGKVSKKSRKRW